MRLIAPVFRGYSPGGTRTVGPFDINVVIDYGQSHTVGVAATPFLSTAQVGGNLKYFDSGWDMAGPPTTSQLGTISLIALKTPLREPPSNGTYPAEYPRNLVAGEQPGFGLANQLATTFGWVCLLCNFGMSGEPISAIKKGGTTNAYAAMLAELGRIVTLAAAASKSVGVVAIHLLHGETDASLGTSDYTAQIEQLYSDIRTDLRAITGQAGDVLLIAAQQNVQPLPIVRPAETLTPLELVATHPNTALAYAKYHLPCYSDKTHFLGPASRALGEIAAKALIRRRLGRASSLQATGAALAGSTITVTFDVPYLPLQWTTTVPACHALTAEWAAGRGFEVETSGGAKVTINSATIVDNTVVVALASSPGASARVSYAMYPDDASAAHGGDAEGRHGQLCDSDPFESYSARSISCDVANGSASITCHTTGQFADRGQREIVTGPGLSGIVHVVSISSDTIVLSAAWTGSTGTSTLRFKNDLRNYALAFSVVL